MVTWCNRQGDDFKGLGFEYQQRKFFTWLSLAILFCSAFFLPYFFTYWLASIYYSYCCPITALWGVAINALFTFYVCELFKFRWSNHHSLLDIGPCSVKQVSGCHASEQNFVVFCPQHYCWQKSQEAYIHSLSFPYVTILYNN